MDSNPVIFVDIDLGFGIDAVRGSLTFAANTETSIATCATPESDWGTWIIDDGTLQMLHCGASTLQFELIPKVNNVEMLPTPKTIFHHKSHPF